MTVETSNTSNSGESAGDSVPATLDIAYPRFARVYNWWMEQSPVRRALDPVRRELVGQAHGLVLEVGLVAGRTLPYTTPRMSYA